MSALVKTRIEPGLKAEAEATLQTLGLDLSTGIRVFLTQVVLRGGLPFEVSLASPNSTTLKAIADSYAGRVQPTASVDALFDEIAKD
jgi:DNA-damage-inducible protein J